MLAARGRAGAGCLLDLHNGPRGRGGEVHVLELLYPPAEVPAGRPARHGVLEPVVPGPGHAAGAPHRCRPGPRDAHVLWLAGRQGDAAGLCGADARRHDEAPQRAGHDNPQRCDVAGDGNCCHRLDQQRPRGRAAIPRRRVRRRRRGLGQELRRLLLLERGLAAAEIQGALRRPHLLLAGRPPVDDQRHPAQGPLEPGPVGRRDEGLRCFSAAVHQGRPLQEELVLGDRIRHVPQESQARF
mmetsp:Transcript_108567/g.306895  ORF Transcript_108567/g.306895 Transcript_108567/m.306895 type:complete len:241 (+) Transcript_108567:322-1044(+)